MGERRIEVEGVRDGEAVVRMSADDGEEFVGDRGGDEGGEGAWGGGGEGAGELDVNWDGDVELESWV